MLDIRQYIGIHQYGRAYQTMLEKDLHAPGSVDRVLWTDMIRLCGETAAFLDLEYTPRESCYRAGSLPALENRARNAAVGCHTAEQVVEGIARFTAESAWQNDGRDLETLRFGGTEEEILDRGSDWCADVARVACALCQVAGIASRLVSLFDLDHAYSGHTIIEVYRNGAWGAVDPLVAIVYRHADGRLASTWDLLTDDAVAQRYRDPTHRAGQAEPRTVAGVVNYQIEDRGRYDYTVSGVNAYYRSILEMGERGWPGGLRWLHGEDKA